MHERTGTPILATAVTAVAAGLFALLVDLEALADLVSVGALTVFFLVSLACLWRRYVPLGELPVAASPALIMGMTAASIGLSASYSAHGPEWLTLAFCGARLQIALWQRLGTLWCHLSSPLQQQDF